MVIPKRGKQSLPRFGIIRAMVRTKDLLLIATALVMLGIAISATVAARLIEQSTAGTELAGQSNEVVPDYEAAVPQSEEDKRAANIARLRALVAQGDVIESSPSVEAPSTSDPVSDGETSSLACGEPSSGIDVARNWPLQGVQVSVAGGSRLVTYAAVTPAATAPTASSSTPAVPAGAAVTLLQLPAYPQKSGDVTCLDTEIVGVTLDGSLIFNADAVLYRSTGSEVLIGYARDGFPIYGGYSGERDQCGGYESATGYRYAASPNNVTFMSCFSGSPQSFNR